MLRWMAVGLMALVVATTRSGAGELDEGPILDSFVLD
jgi:hypothetical protein